MLRIPFHFPFSFNQFITSTIMQSSLSLDSLDRVRHIAYTLVDGEYHVESISSSEKENIKQSIDSMSMTYKHNMGQKCYLLVPSMNELVTTSEQSNKQQTAEQTFQIPIHRHEWAVFIRSSISGMQYKQVRGYWKVCKKPLFFRIYTIFHVGCLNRYCWRIHHMMNTSLYRNKIFIASAPQSCTGKSLPIYCIPMILQMFSHHSNNQSLFTFTTPRRMKYENLKSYIGMEVKRVNAVDLKSKTGHRTRPIITNISQRSTTAISNGNGFVHCYKHVSSLSFSPQ